MAASFQAKDSAILNKQLLVQEIVVKAGDPLISVVSSDLQIDIGETLLSVEMCVKQVAAGTLSGIACTITGGSKIVITGESAAVATTRYMIKYIVAE
jgi:hypothetical protein